MFSDCESENSDLSCSSNSKSSKYSYNYSPEHGQPDENIISWTDSDCGEYFSYNFGNA